jgi:hypothetical protein
MQRFHITNSLPTLADSPNPPARENASPKDNVVPASFADWLSRPARTITDAAELEQGIFSDLINECHMRITDKLPLPLRRH